MPLGGIEYLVIFQDVLNDDRLCVKFAIPQWAFFRSKSAP